MACKGSAVRTRLAPLVEIIAAKTFRNQIRSFQPASAVYISVQADGLGVRARLVVLPTGLGMTYWKCGLWV
jgi:hypothetical protein